jgi:hypothetical protein
MVALVMEAAVMIFSHRDVLVAGSLIVWVVRAIKRL